MSTVTPRRVLLGLGVAASLFLVHWVVGRAMYVLHAVVDVGRAESVYTYGPSLGAAVRIRFRSERGDVHVRSYSGDALPELVEAVAVGKSGGETVGVFLCGGPSSAVLLAFSAASGKEVEFSPAIASALRSNLIKRDGLGPAELNAATKGDPMYWACNSWDAFGRFYDSTGGAGAGKYHLPAID